MAPSDKTILAALKSAVNKTYKDAKTRDLLTVRYVRELVQEELGLDDGFFVEGEWKGRSKEAVRGFTNELLAQGSGSEDELEQGGLKEDVRLVKQEKRVTPKAKKIKGEVEAKKSVKRESAGAKGRPAKRQKKEESVSADEDMGSDELPEEDDEESEFGDSEESEAPRKGKAKIKAKVKTPVKKRGKGPKVESEDEDEDMEDVESPKPKKEKVVAKRKSDGKAPVKRQTKTVLKIEDPGDESSVSNIKNDSSDEKPKKKPVSAKKSKSKVESEDEDIKTAKDSDSDAAPASAKKASVKKEIQQGVFKKAPESEDEKIDIKTIDAKAEASDSEMSVLIDEDEAPKKKRRSKSSPQPKSSKTKATKEPKVKAASKTKAPDKDLSPDELMMKTLQSQLKKCGITKIWAFELKQYGDDTKARVRHLQKALADVGMKGRFSEARAREIKEMRELQADLEAVKEGEKNWGMESGRASRSKGGRKAMVDSGSEGEEEGGGGESASEKSESGNEQPVRKRVNARSALAFLGSESDE